MMAVIEKVDDDAEIELPFQSVKNQLVDLV